MTRFTWLAPVFVLLLLSLAACDSARGGAAGGGSGSGGIGIGKLGLPF